MDTSTLINLIAAILVAIGTLTLAFMTWKSIRQTRNIQKSEKRQRLLNEIIEWALDAAKCGSRGVIKDLPTLEEATKNVRRMKLSQSITCGNIELESIVIKNRGAYIKNIALAFQKDLQEAVNTLMKEVNDHKDILDKYRLSFMDIPDNIDEFRSVLEQHGNEI